MAYVSLDLIQRFESANPGLLIQPEADLDEYDRVFVDITQEHGHNLIEHASNYGSHTITEIYSALIFGTDVNAFAVRFSDTQTAIIGCTKVTPRALLSVFSRYLTSQSDFPEIGRGSVVVGRYGRFLPPDLSADSTQFMPNSEARARLAGMMSEIVARFMVAHEVGHIIHGPVGSDSFHFEQRSADELGRNVEKHISELDADAFAASWMAESIDSMLMNPVGLERALGRRLSQYEHLQIFLRSITIYFVAFSGTRVPSEAFCDFKFSHPNPIMRTLHVQACILKCLENRPLRESAFRVCTENDEWWSYMPSHFGESSIAVDEAMLARSTAYFTHIESARQNSGED